VGRSIASVRAHESDRNIPLEQRQRFPALAAADHRTAAGFLLDWLEAQRSSHRVTAAGHRVVMMKHIQPEIVTQDLLDELTALQAVRSDHLPRESEKKLIDHTGRRTSGNSPSLFERRFTRPCARW